MAKIRKRSKKGESFLRRFERVFLVAPPLIYKALEWDRQRYRDVILNNRPIALEREFMDRLARLEGVGEAALKRFTMEFLFS